MPDQHLPRAKWREPPRVPPPCPCWRWQPPPKWPVRPRPSIPSSSRRPSTPRFPACPAMCDPPPRHCSGTFRSSYGSLHSVVRLYHLGCNPMVELQLPNKPERNLPWVDSGTRERPRAVIKPLARPLHTRGQALKYHLDARRELRVRW